ncbi:hypothetical protein ElyMa_000339400 [Elysia marginata]|uniref:Secreted protein n=1 Tax=Elysia marginata TaxID=1093978 RepID=A0AAV4FDZ3_9GAST|nr:hypothetical protein ElyMa_000339400 [Elysia marginata]
MPTSIIVIIYLRIHSPPQPAAAETETIVLAAFTVAAYPIDCWLRDDNKLNLRYFSNTITRTAYHVWNLLLLSHL